MPGSPAGSCFGCSKACSRQRTRTGSCPAFLWRICISKQASQPLTPDQIVYEHRFIKVLPLVTDQGPVQSSDSSSLMMPLLCFSLDLLLNWQGSGRKRGKGFVTIINLTLNFSDCKVFCMISLICSTINTDMLAPHLASCGKISARDDINGADAFQLMMS